MAALGNMCQQKALVITGVNVDVWLSVMDFYTPQILCLLCRNCSILEKNQYVGTFMLFLSSRQTCCDVIYI